MREQKEGGHAAPEGAWQLVEEPWQAPYSLRNETLFALGNGYLGMRGNMEEGLPGGPSVRGTFINGFYEEETIQYGEKLYGFPDRGQTMLNITDAKTIQVRLADESFSLLQGSLLAYRRWIDFREGVLRRQLRWRSPRGRELELETSRLISLPHKHRAAIQWQIRSLNFTDEVEVVSLVDGDVANLSAEDDPRVGAKFSGRVLSVDQKEAGEEGCHLVQSAEKSGMALCCAAGHRVKVPGGDGAGWREQSFETGLAAGVRWSGILQKGQALQLEKYIAYVSSRDVPRETLVTAAEQEREAAAAGGFDGLAEEQADYLRAFWSRADVVIQGDDDLQMGIRYNLFQLLQSAGRDGKTNIGAKGLAGEGYEGHYFWDTETYMFPVFLYNRPDIARALLAYRYNTLDAARRRARQVGHPRGALFPWRTIDGDECSPYYPAGTAQYHIDADVAFAVKRYVDVTGDRQFLYSMGAEILVETARLWMDLGDFIEARGGAFCLNSVTGPDEYTLLVNNNVYTNLMARENLKAAASGVQDMAREAPEAWQDLSARLEYSPQEAELWQKAAERMYLPYDAERRLYPQDDSFFHKALWDFERTPKSHYPLLLHYHPLVINRYQVCKQADLLLAEFLLGDQFDRDQKRRDYAYYEAVTTHDSSLSACIFSILAVENGDLEKGYDYFMKTARTDLDDHKGNTKDGIHAANMAGAWMCVVNGFGGLRQKDGRLSLNPQLPPGWTRLTFRVTFRDRLILVDAARGASGEIQTSLELLEGDPVEVRLGGRMVNLEREGGKG